MSSEEHKEQEQEEQEPPQQYQQYPETRQADTWNKDVGETGRWGSRSRKELYFVAGLIVVIIGATITGVVLSASSGGSSEPVGATKIDPSTGKVVSAYQFPVPPAPTTVSDQQELDFVRDQITRNAAMAAHLAVIPASISDLTGTANDATADPYARAASWLVTVDTTNAKEQAVTRFALAAIYYVNGGANWTNTTNWLSPTTNHCHWHGIICCPEVPASTKCGPTDFYGVIEVDLWKNNLVGTVPDAIALLPELQALFMSDNSLTGSIPGAVFSSLEHFTKLYLQHNNLTGTIPTELINNGVFDTIMVMGNDLGGSFPQQFCPTCQSCHDNVVNFGVDCQKVVCTATCCQDWQNCFFHDKN